MKKYNNSGYSVILAILMVGFMLVLTSGIFSLVMVENKDTKAMEYYLKAFAGAEGSLELAMLKAKEYNYSYSERLTISDEESKVLYYSNSFNKNKDVTITYDLNANSSEIRDKTLSSGEFDIIPLFYLDNSKNYKKVKNIVISGLNDDVVWNIVGENGGITGVSNFSNTTNGNYRTISSDGSVNFSNMTIGKFLEDSEKNYLILHNVSGNSVNYTLKSLNEGEYITKDASYIVGSGDVGGYKQNLRVKIDNSKYLNLLKYSIFSN